MGTVVGILRNMVHFKKYLEWGPFLVCFYVRQCVGFCSPIVVFELYVGTGTKAQIDFFVKINQNKILLHSIKIEVEGIL